MTPKKTSGSQVSRGVHRALAAATSVFGVMGVAPAASADTPASDTTQLEEIIVTASKRAEPLREVAGGVNAATGEFLDKIGAQSLADYAAFIPGMTLQSSGRPGYSAVTLRGITPLSVGSATGTYVDDVPLGSSNNYSSGAITAPDIDPNDLERVEVLKGPQGTLYGASSLGGLVKYVTRAPDLNNLSGYASAGFTQIQHGGTGYEARGGINLPLIEGQLGARLSVFDRRDGGYIRNAFNGEDDINSDTVRGFRAQLMYKPNDAFTARFSSMFQETRGDGIGAVDTNRNLVPTYGDLTVSRRLDETNRVIDRLNSATLAYDFGFATLTSATGFSQVRSDPISDYSQVYPVQYAAFVPAGSTSPVLAGTYTDKWTEELRLASPSNGHLEWLVGGFFQDEHSKTNQNFRILQPDGQLAPGLYGVVYQNFYHTSLKEYAGFGDLTYYFNPKFDVTAGYRLSSDEQDITRARTGLLGNPASPTTYRVRSQSSSENVSTYLLTARWHISSDSLLYARAASGYRPGGPRDIAPGANPGPDFVYSFKADTVWDYELGARSAWLDNRLTADVSVFYINWHDIQALAPVITPSGTFMVFDNAGNAVSKGFEFTGQALPLRNLTLTATAGYTDATLSQDSAAFSAHAGDPLTNIPKWTGSFAADYQFALVGAWEGFTGASFRYTSKLYTQFSLSPIRQTLPGYGAADFRFGAKRNKFTATVYLKNITDTRGYTTASSINSSLPYQVAVDQPRSYGLTLGMSF